MIQRNEWQIVYIPIQCFLNKIDFGLWTWIVTCDNTLVINNYGLVVLVFKTKSILLKGGLNPKYTCGPNKPNYQEKYEETYRHLKYMYLCKYSMFNIEFEMY